MGLGWGGVTADDRTNASPWHSRLRCKFATLCAAKVHKSHSQPISSLLCQSLAKVSSFFETTWQLRKGEKGKRWALEESDLGFLISFPILG